ncbi:MAG TPA: Asp-tRNA(Asn)/Glu-tRNA(Gln) amidotransferase GatCAB subunit A, partial [Verrucomicrobiales bacterium]|nr:Asp-tRNA(Asn)/Glu-tRNA(Gln) amidotransferase GatCAB subunit A [Verrucomicrobiales bacterium]
MLNQLTIAELTDRLAGRQVSAVEATRACLERVQAVDDRVKAFLSWNEADALAQAEAADRALADGATHAERPLLGVPVALKDIFAVKGQPCGVASQILKGFVSPYSGTVVQKLQAAGAVVFGRLNMDEFAMGSSTENSSYHTTLNPWDTTRIPGGSSGGSAAAVAARMAFGATATDTGGSIRQP